MLECSYCKSRKIKKKCKNLNFYECNSCGLYVRYPMPSSSELEQIYKKCYSEENININSTNQLSPVEGYKKLAKYISEKFLCKQSNNILDYGAGTGGLLKELYSINRGKNSVFDGIEYSQDAISSVNKESQGVSLYSDLNSLKDIKYDIVTMIEVIEHLTHPWDDLNSLYNYIDDDGIIIISTPNLKGLNSILSGCNWREQIKPFHLIMFEKTFLYKLLKDVGFKNIEFIRFYPTSSETILQKVKTYILQFLGLYGGIFVVARK